MVVQEIVNYVKNGKKSQIWKTFEFFPVHYHLCMEPGNTEDFERVNIFLICLKCNDLLKKEKKVYLENNISNKAILTYNPYFIK